jgi:transposase
MPKNRKPYPSDVSDEEWTFVASYLALVREDAPQRAHDLREVFNALRWIVRAGASWRMLPHDFPPWEAVYQQTQRWLRAGVFEAMVHDLRALLRLASGREPDPRAERSSNSAAHCVRHPRADRGRVTTAPSARRAPRCTRPSTL